VGRGANNADSRRIQIRVTPQLADYLEELAKLGIHGGSAAEVAKYFVQAGVERMMKDRILTIRET